MNALQKSEAIKNSLRKVFRTAVPRWLAVNTMDMRLTLMVNPEEAKVVRWIFEHYLSGESLGKIAAGLVSPLPVSPGGTVRLSINYSPTKNILDGYCSRRQSALAQFKLKMMASWTVPIYRHPCNVM